MNQLASLATVSPRKKVEICTMVKMHLQLGRGGESAHESDGYMRNGTYESSAFQEIKVVDEPDLQAI